MTRAGKSCALSSIRSPFRSNARTRDLPRARHAAADVGNAQAAFPVLDDVAADDGDLRVDDRDRLGIRVLVVIVAGVERGDEQPQALVHLRRRQADAVILDHRLDHVVDQLLDRPRF